MEQTVLALSLADFKSAIKNSSNFLLDTRKATEFTTGFIPGAVSIGLEGRFAEWAAGLIQPSQPIILVTAPGTEQESVNQLARVGLTAIIGFLDGGFETWMNSGEPIDMIVNIEADELAMDIPFDERLVVLDVRRETEFGDGHVAEAVNIPLSEFIDPASMGNIVDEQNLYVHCATGYRSVVASSLMKKQGIHNLRNVVGGFEAIKQQQKIEIVRDNRVLN